MKALHRVELLTVSFGIGLIILAICRFWGIVIVPPIFVTGVSIAGICFTLTDFFEMGLINKEEKSWHKWHNEFFTALINACYLTAILGIIVLPNLNSVENASPEVLNKISDFTSFAALGLAIVAIATRNRSIIKSNIYSEFYENKKELRRVEGLLNEARQEAQAVRDEIINREKELIAKPEDPANQEIAATKDEQE
ncbi:hypothetical protein [Bacillus sp. OTU530]|uniref:hypothetical protein n=1 Tax=Bacillus sp. OTU530 TaxID=3043862 RepID=UPI00313D614C